VSILSIQSHVAYGHVGNRAAVFPLERMGYEVWPINTVQFSNHMGYGSWTGEIFTSAHLALVWSGVKALGHIGDCEAILSGYMGAAEIGHFIVQAMDEVKSGHPGALYCCDPVMGDYGRGFFVAEGISEFITGHVVPVADIVTPNQFEAEVISGSAISGIDDAKRACDIIHKIGPSIVLITNFRPTDQPDRSISMFMSSKEGFRMLTTPELPLDPPPNGAGDLTAALFLGHLLARKDPVKALELMSDSVFSVFEKTYTDRGRELSIVAAQEAIAHPGKRFAARKV
jgi:pyridoxine kinase